MIGSGFLYLGLVVSFAGVVCLVKPLTLLGLSRRAHGAILVAAGLLVSIVALVSPAPRYHVETPRTALDGFAPDYQFHEVHRVRVQASRERVLQAIRAVRADEIALFRALTWLRRFGRPGPQNILNPGDREPILAVATRTGFLLLAEDPEREIVVGTVVVGPPGGTRREAQASPEVFRALQAPGWAKAVMNFQVEDASGGSCVVTTETRVHATSASARRRFAVYWRVIYPGSSIIRAMWLRAIRKRAETAGYSPGTISTKAPSPDLSPGCAPSFTTA